MKKLILSVLCGFGVTTAGLAQNLVVNGDFETGNQSGWAVQGNFVSSNPYQYASFPGAHTGNYYLSGGSVGGLAFDSQTVITQPNTNYRLTYFLASDGAFTNRAQVNFNGTTLFDQTNIPLQGYTGYTYIVTATGASALLEFGLRDDPAYLSLDTISLVPLFSTIPGLTPNQQAIAANLDSFSGNTGTFVNVLSAVANSPNMAAAIQSLSPQNLQILHSIAFDNFGFTATQLDDHLASLRYGNGGLDMSGLQVFDSTMPSSLSQIKGRLLAFNAAPVSNSVISDSADSAMAGVDMTEIAPKSNDNRWSTFVSGNVIIADASSNSDVANSHFTTGGVSAGADYRLDNNWAVGGLFSYGRTNATTDSNGSKIQVDSYSPGIYATYSDHGWFANGLFSYNYNHNSESRVIPFLGSTATGSPDGNQFNTNFDGGYEFRKGNWTFGPTAALQYVHLEVNSFTETGAGPADLAIGEQDVNSLRSRFGGQVRYNWALYGGKVTATPHLSATWQHEYLDNSSGITSQFSGSGTGSFTVNTTSPDRDSALLDVGIDTQWNSAFNMFLDYQAQAGQSNFFAQSIQGGCKVSF